jgi:uncharacterized protein YbbC (DUF1343 family)
VELAAYLNRRLIPGIRVYATHFRPSSAAFQDKDIEGVRFLVTDREACNPVRLGLELASALERLYPGRIDLSADAKLIGSRKVSSALRTGADPRSILMEIDDGLRDFLATRENYLLYK